MLFTFLLVVHAIIAAVLVTSILMQQSEGGGLGMGGSPSGLMSARGAANFLTRLTSITAALFVGLSIVLAILAAAGHSQGFDTSLAHRRAAPPSPVTAPAADPGAPPAAAPNTSSPTQPGNSAVPLAR